MRNTCNFCPMVVHSATQISNCDLQDENHGICNRKVMCLYMQKCFLGRKKIFLCHLSRKGMKLVLYGCVTGLLGVFKDFCHTHRICSSSAMNHTEALLPFSSFFFFFPFLIFITNITGQQIVLIFLVKKTFVPLLQFSVSEHHSCPSADYLYLMVIVT